MLLDGSDSLTLSASPASDSEVIAGLGQILVASTAHSVTHGTGWTETYESATPTSFSHSQGQTRTGSTSTTVLWDDVAADVNTVSVCIGAALEIKAAAGAGGAVMGHDKPIGRGIAPGVGF